MPAQYDDCFDRVERSDGDGERMDVRPYFEEPSIVTDISWKIGSAGKLFATAKLAHGAAS